MATQQSEQIIIPSSPADRQKLKGMIEEIARCMQRMDDEKSHIKDILDEAKENFEIHPKYIKRMAKAYYKNDFNDTKVENDEFETLYETIVDPTE